MLTKEDNELLTRTGPGTPMGTLFRRFWWPALLPSELPRADSDPLRFRIMGEDLIAFRDTNGKVGFLANNCPHRGASLFFGRNEEAGLRCVYHGWKFDVDGTCIDMPNEPAESDFKAKVKAVAYPSAEYAGVVWIYMGPPEKQPPLPNYQWCMQPNAERSTASKWMQDSNYAQALEGNIDSSHITFLHRTFDNERYTTGLVQGAQQTTVARETEFGFVYGARRAAPDAQYYWRVTTYSMPTFTQIPNSGRGGGGIFVIPRDDESHWWITVRPPQPDDTSVRSDPSMNPAMPGLLSGASVADPSTLGLAPGSWRHVRNKDNDYMIDRQMQKTFNYSGLPGNRVQDMAVTESMGTIFDRSSEHLGAADTAIIVMRRQLLRMARELEQGIEPSMLANPDHFRTAPLAVVTPEPDFSPVWDAHAADLEAEFARGSIV